jgi:GNAT superfamily N-acetyltransferase
MKIPELTIISTLDPPELERLVTLVNYAYVEGEKGICRPDLQRVSLEKMRQIIEKNELIILRINNIPQGCIQVSPSVYNKDAGMFGMLAVAQEPEFRKKGFGTLLVNEAEGWAKSQGYRFMDLELLKATDFIHAHKDRLQSWYEKRGYVYQYSQQFTSEELLMIKNYDFKIFRKLL